MPAAADLLADPAFASLTFRNHLNYEPTRGAGYDVWADSRFEYRTGLQSSFVPTTRGRAGAQFCAVDLALRLALPVDARGEALIGQFSRLVAARAGLDPAQLASRIAEALAKRSKYGQVASSARVIVESGVVSSSVRGEFFVVAFNWPDPARR
jgi:hypothetical protein